MGIGDDNTLKAPLAAEQLGQQRIACAAPGKADAVEGGHGSIGAALLHGPLKDLQIVLTHGLLVCPGGDAVGIAVVLLVVQCEVLHKGNHALGACARNHIGCHGSGQGCILGVVFKVTAREGSAVDIQTRSIPANDVGPQAVITNQLALTGCNILVPGAANQSLSGEGELVLTGEGLQHTASAADPGTGQANGAIGVTGHRSAQSVNSIVLELSGSHHFIGLVNGQLGNELIPLRIVIAYANHVGQLDGCGIFSGISSVRRLEGRSGFCIPGGIFVIGGGNHSVAFRCALNQRHGKMAQELVITHHVLFAGGGGEGALPVRTGQDMAFHLSGGVSETGSDVCTSHRVNVDVQLGALHRQDSAVRPGIVGILADIQGVSTGIQLIPNVAVAVLVISIEGSHIKAVHRQGNRLGSTGLQQLSLGEVAQDNVGLFGFAGFVGCGEVELHNVLTGNGTGVGHGHVHSEVGLLGQGVGVHLQLAHLPIEGGVAQAIAEGIIHRLVVPILAVGIAAGLIILVAQVDAFLVLD